MVLLECKFWYGGKVGDDEQKNNRPDIEENCMPCQESQIYLVEDVYWILCEEINH